MKSIFCDVNELSNHYLNRRINYFKSRSREELYHFCSKKPLTIKNLSNLQLVRLQKWQCLNSKCWLVQLRLQLLIHLLPSSLRLSSNISSFWTMSTPKTRPSLKRLKSFLTTWTWPYRPHFTQRFSTRLSECSLKFCRCGFRIVKIIERSYDL